MKPFRLREHSPAAPLAKGGSQLAEQALQGARDRMAGNEAIDISMTLK
jgi:hypothetical protein